MPSTAKRAVRALLRLLLPLLLSSALSQAAQAQPAQRLIVQYKSSLPLPARLSGADRKVLEAPAARAGVQLSRLRATVGGADVLRISGRPLGTAELASLIAQLAADPNVEYVEEDRLLHALFTPDDPRYNEQWGYYESTAGLRLPQAWDSATGSGVVVAVIDTGYRPHADLAANIVGGYDFISDATTANDGDGRDADARDPGDAVAAGECGLLSPAETSSWHGTHVAGTIAALTNNSLGVAGVAFNAKVLPLRVLGKCGGYTSDIADAMVWASGGHVTGVPDNPNVARVINLSLGGSGSCDKTSQNAINIARANGTAVVVAAGNESRNASRSSPANCSGVITVAAINRNGARASYSNYGAVVDVAAPGGQMSSATDANGILSTLNDGAAAPAADSYTFYQGTSMATPHVAGVAALVLSKNPALTPDRLEAVLKNSARAFPASCSQCGVGIVDAAAAVALANQASVAVCAAGYQQFDGSIASGANVYLPASAGYSAVAGTQLATLAGDAGSNFDLYLEQLSKNLLGTSWRSVASGTGASSAESLSYSGAAGSYRLRIYARSGSGAYTACLKTP